MISLKQQYSNYKSLQRQKEDNRPYQVQFYNFWKQEIPDMWFYRFLEYRGLITDSKKICFFSTFGGRDVVGHVGGDINIFFSGENLKRECFATYADHMLGRADIDLAMGFEQFESARYMRFPLWLHYMFKPDSSEQDIVERCRQLNNPEIGERTRFACHVSSEDTLGYRKRLCETLSQIAQVDCAGKVLHNCDDLWNKYGNDKHSFLQQYRFNICPENSNCEGYVTEKLLQSIAAGCVPIYWGSNNQAERKFINQESVIYWGGIDNKECFLTFIKELESSPIRYQEFAHQDRLVEGAAEYVVDLLDELERRVREML